MKQYYILIIFLVLIFASCSKNFDPGSSQKESFVKYYGEYGHDKGVGVITLSDGYYLTSTISSNTISDISIIKTNLFGNQVGQSFKISTDHMLEANDMISDKEGNLYILATEYLDEPQANTDIILYKFSPDHEKLWEQTIRDDGNETGVDIILFGDNIYLLGNTESIANHGIDALMYMYDTDGNLLRRRTYGSYLNDEATSIIQLGSNLYFTGFTKSYDLHSIVNGDIWMVKTDLFGRIVGQAVIGTTGIDKGQNLVALSSDEILIAGNTATTTTNPYNLLLLSVDPISLTKNWQKEYPIINASLSPKSIILWNNTILILENEELSNSNISKIGLMQFDLNGTLMWRNIFGSETKLTVNSAVMTGTDGGIILSGTNEYKGFSESMLLKLDNEAELK